MNNLNKLKRGLLKYSSFAVIIFTALGARSFSVPNDEKPTLSSEVPGIQDSTVVHPAVQHDISPVLAALQQNKNRQVVQSSNKHKVSASYLPKDAAAIEQTSQGRKPAARLVASFDGLGVGFRGPQGWTRLRNPSDNSLAVGPNHIVQIVNTRMAIFTKKGEKFDTTGKALYGPVKTSNVFRGFGGPCENINNGDAVARYDQLANRWLIVMPLFSRAAKKINRPLSKAGEGAKRSIIGQKNQPGKATPLYNPPHDTSEQVFHRRNSGGERYSNKYGSYGMCYAVSTGPNPLGSYYRYEFDRQHFPDYPRPAVWPDGYYVPTSAGDDVIKEKEACVADRNKMLKGEKATEQCVYIKGANFLNNADLEGKQLPPAGAPNIMMAAGGTQLKGDFEDDGIYIWKYHVNWDDPSKTKLKGPEKINVAPYHFLCDGQLTSCVPQPGTDTHLDSQGDKIMARLVYRRIGDQESIVSVHSVNTSAGGGGVRWYEFRLDKQRDVTLYQQGTYAPDKYFRWMGSPAMDKNGNIGIGYSFGGTPNYTGQRFAGRLAGDPKGKLTLHETILAQGEGSQKGSLRWEDYTQTAVDPGDDCTIWYVGDYYKKDAPRYSTKIGAFRMPGCRDNK